MEGAADIMYFLQSMNSLLVFPFLFSSRVSNNGFFQRALTFWPQ